MTEEEWLGATDPSDMLIMGFLLGKLSDRKYGLFAAACCRAIWQDIPNETCRNGILVAERHTDGFASLEELRNAQALTLNSFQNEENCSDNVYTAWLAVLHASYAVQRITIWDAAFATALFVSKVVDRHRPTYSPRYAICLIAFDIFGNPFRPVTFNPSWLTPTVVALASGIYAEMAFDRMPILADALQDAGCDNEDILSHCRQQRKHVRGCWVVDLVLGKK
jgi:hypothetical protein